MRALAKRATRMTVEEFFAWDPQDGLAYELVDGEPNAMAPASNVHGYLQAALTAYLFDHLRKTRPGCVVLANPGVIPKFFSRHNCRIPDLAVTCTPLAPGQATVAEPLLLVEILSPSNEAATWSNACAYTSIPSVREILVLSSTEVTADIFRRLPDGTWPDNPDAITNANLRLASIDFEVPLEELYARTGIK